MTREYKSSSPGEFRLHSEELQAEMERQDIDMLLLSIPENIYYSVGYRSWYTSSLFRSVYVLAPREGGPAIILRILEETTVQYTSWTSRIYCWGTASRSLGPLEDMEPVNIIDRIIKEIQPGTRTIDLEAGNGVQYFWSMGLLKRIIDSQPGICFADDSLAVQRARVVKTSWETERIRHVCRITERAILDTGKTIVAGETTEKDISKGVTMRMTQGGAGKISYLTVTSGIDKYCTFGTYATDRVVQKGEYILVNISGHIDGYASDLTRVFYLGTVPREEREMTEITSGCVAAAKEAMKPGVSIVDISRICEGYIRDSRFGKFLLHSSGYCIGLNMVEYPTTYGEVGEKLKPDMVLAVGNGVYPYDLEKGMESIYLSFRMEDEVLVTENSAEWITGPGEPMIEVGADKQANSIL